ncbi:MAG: dTDP-glucose 4,6-dehydratase [Candidatus Eremiobacterota bacterium]
MKILVTGGAGFIGSEFIRQCVRSGHNIVLVDKLTYAADLKRLEEVEKDITFYHSDINNREFINYIFSEEKPEVIAHWAAESHVDRSIVNASPFIEANVKGTQVLLDICRNYDIKKIINISTDEVYGDLGEEGQFFEYSPLCPNSPYSVSKTSADMLGRAYYRTYGLPVITVRPSNNYGPWQYPEKLVPVVILKALSNKPVPVYGKGENVREWLYVSDCAGAILKIIEAGKEGEIYNIGSSQERKNIDTVKSILHILGKSEDLIDFVKDRPGHDFRYSLNTDKVKSEISWEASVKFEEGMEKTVKWYVEHMDWVEKKISYLKSLWDKVYIKS